MEKTKLSFSLDATIIPTPIETKVRGKEYVSWGEDNLYPQYIYSLYTQCTMHQTICKGLSEYIYGNGVDTQLNVDEVINVDGETLTDIIKQAINDYVIFGGFCIQVIFSEDSTKIVELYNLEMENVRVGTLEDDDSGEEIDYVYYTDKWDKWGSKAVRIEQLHTKNRYGSKAFLYKENVRGRYPIPSYIGSIKDIETAIKISDFHLNNINNGFAASAIISLNNGEPNSEEDKERIVQDITDIYSGSENAGAFMVVFNKSKENGVEIQRLQSDDFDSKFTELRKNTMQAIFCSHRVTSPVLFGIMQENQGFNSTEFQQAFDIFQSTVIKYSQHSMEKAFKKLLLTPIKLKKFELNVTLEQPIQDTPIDSTN